MSIRVVEGKMRGVVRSLLRFAGKSESKVAAVFGFQPEACRAAVEYLRKGAPDVPVWLFTTVAPPPETVALCERVVVRTSPLALLLQAERSLWPRWVAIGVTTWTGEHGRWPLKLAPFLVPPFRVLVLNDHGDFLSGTPAAILRHGFRRLRDALHSGGNRLWDWARFLWLLVTYHVWRSTPVRRVRDEAAGLGLLAVSTVLRLSRYPQRRLFHRLHGSERLEVTTADPAGDGVACLRQAGSHWDGEKIERFANDSNARWILWQNGSAADPPRSMAALFDDRTFAVSLQSHFRGWKRMLFPTAPFRALQRGEASQVLAPISETILVDRLKLAALGIPRCSLAGTAWMLLFWKAAAAGWRSYSLGGVGRILEQPDHPMQEAGFVLRLLASRSLRRLGPRQPQLARGSIAFQPAASRASRPERLVVLVVSPFLPYPLSHGGAVRMYNLCRTLNGRVDFILAAVRERHDVVDYPKLHEVFREAYVVDTDERPSGDPEWPEQVRQHQSRSLRALVAELVNRWQPDLLQVEYTCLADLRDGVPGVPAILVEHDLTFSLYRQLAEKNVADPAAQREYRRWLDYERHFLGRYDGVWTVSEDDRDTAIREGRRRADRTFTIPNGVDTQRFHPCDEPGSEAEILYVGSFRHLPNILGFEKLCREVMPRVWAAHPEARLRVVAGPEHKQFWNRFAREPLSKSLDARIDMHDFVEDLAPLYAAATVVVVPLEVSAGTNIKVLEAMACGKAVVTTPIGCAGLNLRDRHDAFIDAGWDAFAGSVNDLLADAALRRCLGAEARRTAEARFSWDAIAECAWHSYRALCRAAN